ncbi:hypothetical protein J5X84_36275 [Streptosporangiaceae bacterium NEAU-GS5]|nr:hypothetical protein [Streptosporangiaceae bacterium NEAU-GS5]
MTERTREQLEAELADSLARILANYEREGAGPGSRFDGQTVEIAQARYAVRQVLYWQSGQTDAGELCGDDCPSLLGQAAVSCKLPAGHATHRSGITFWAQLCDEAHQRLEQAEAEVARLRAGEAEHLPPEHAEHTPAEWIRRWNDETPEKRLRVLGALLDAAGRGHRCFMLNHEARLADAAQTLTDPAAVARVRAIVDSLTNPALQADLRAALDGEEADR